MPAGRKIASSVYGRPTGILLSSRAAATPTTLRAYQLRNNADRYETANFGTKHHGQ
jgi:hypothetical protein